MIKPKITLDELIDIASNCDSLSSYKVLDYLYREDFKDALDDVISMLGVLDNDQYILSDIIESAIDDYNEDESTRITNLILALDEEYHYRFTFEGLTSLLKNIRNKERLELYKIILESINFDDIKLEFFDILQKYSESERKIVLDNARSISKNDLIYQIRSSMQVIKKMEETLELELD